MFKRYIVVSFAAAAAVASGCTLEEPCEPDEIYSTGVCIKCRDYGDHHIDANGYCVKDSVDACGESVTDCTVMPGVSNVECLHGECMVWSCDANLGYVLDSNRCVQQDTYSCGSAKVNCVGDWLGSLYPDASWVEGSTPVCMDGHCAIGACAPGFSQISCADYKTRFEEDYKKQFGADFSIPVCESDSNRDTKFCLKYICPIDGLSNQKIVPGQCGCGIAEDTGDNDYDGVMNCKDACPDNPTKWNKDLWWNGSAGIRCDVWDTDRDGVDDEADACPTREGLSEAESDCGISVTGEDGVREFHIYNALDLEELRTVLYEIYNRYSCISESDTCKNSTTMNACKNGYKLSYNCTKCTDASGSDPLKCTNKTYKSFGTQLRVYLENDINLDDDIDTIFRKPKKQNTGTESQETMCYGIWMLIPHMFAVDFDGKGNTIHYYRKQEEPGADIRCRMMDSLFGEIAFSNVHDLNIDFDMSGYGHSLFANTIYSSTFKKISIKGCELETSNLEAGIGGIAGNAYNAAEENSTDNYFEEITLDNVHISAPNAQNVGGMVGYSGGTLHGKNIEVHQVSVAGDSYTGGLIGLANRLVLSGDYKQTDSEITGANYIGGVVGGTVACGDNNNPGFGLDANKVEIKGGRVSGSNSVGGFCGYGDAPADAQINLQLERVNGSFYVGGVYGKLCNAMSPGLGISADIDSVEGDYYVGGIFGDQNFYLSQLMGGQPYKKRVVSHIGEVKGISIVGGYAGAASWVPANDASGGIWLYNIVGKVTGTGDSIGGMIGSTSGGSTTPDYRNIYNQVGEIEGSGGVGGFIGSTGNPVSRFQRVYNRIQSIRAEENAGGFIGNASNFNFEGVDSQVGSIAISGNAAGGLIGRTNGGVFDIKNTTQSVGEITGALQIGGMIGFADNQSNIDHTLNLSMVHSDVANIQSKGNHGGMIGRIRDDRQFKISINKLTSYTNLSLCSKGDYEYQQLGLVGNHASGSIELKNAMFATFSTNPDKHYACSYEISDGLLNTETPASVYWYQPEGAAEDEFAPFGPGSGPSESAAPFKAASAESVAQKTIGTGEYRIISFSYGNETIQLPAAMCEAMLSQIMPNIDNSYINRPEE